MYLYNIKICIYIYISPSLSLSSIKMKLGALEKRYGNSLLPALQRFANRHA